MPELPLDKGRLVRIVGDRIADTFVFQYNPNTLNRSMGVEHRMSKAPGQYMPVASFTQFGADTLTLNLFLYGLEASGHGSADVEKELARLELFVSPGPDFSRDQPRFVSPGKAELVWGRRTWRGVINRIDTTEVRWNRRLICFEASAAISFTRTSDGLAGDLTYLNRVRGRAGLDG